MMREMPFEKDVVVWSSVLRASRECGDVERGRVAAEEVIRLDLKCSGAHITLENMYASDGRWKEPGWSWVKVEEERVSAFVAGDRNHRRCEEVYGMLGLGYCSSEELSFEEVDSVDAKVFLGAENMWFSTDWAVQYSRVNSVYSGESRRRREPTVRDNVPLQSVAGEDDLIGVGVEQPVGEQRRARRQLVGRILDHLKSIADEAGKLELRWTTLEGVKDRKMTASLRRPTSLRRRHLCCSPFSCRVDPADRGDVPRQRLVTAGDAESRRLLAGGRRRGHTSGEVRRKTATTGRWATVAEEVGGCGGTGCGGWLVKADLLTSSNIALSLRQSITIRLYSNSYLAYADFSGTLISDDRLNDPPTPNLHDSSLINMLELNSQLKHLTKSGDLKTARNMFDTFPQRDEITWTTMIAGYISSSDTSEAISLFSKIWVSFIRSVFVGSSVLDMYMKNGRVLEGCAVYDEMPSTNVVSWTAVIIGVVRAGLHSRGLLYFSQMWRDGVDYDSYTFSIALRACADLEALLNGKEIHARILKRGVETTTYVANSLSTMYNKCGKVEYGSFLFESMAKPDVVSWTSMITTYIQTGQEKQGINSFSRMRACGISPNEYTYAAVISGVANIAKLKWGLQLHACESIFTYPKRRYSLVDDHDQRIRGARINRKAIELFERIPNAGLRPDSVTFIGVLGACNHAGLLDLGSRYFDSMIKKYRIYPCKEHYGCMIDLFCRAGWLACLGLVGSVVTWSAGGSRLRRWKEAAGVRRLMRWRGVVKEEEERVSAFIAGDRNHPRCEKVYGVLGLVYCSSEELSFEEAVLNRHNKITGVAYKNDLAIMAWKLMNEPRCNSNLKYIDQKHLLEIGLEGFYGQIFTSKDQDRSQFQHGD
ncbi:pentatricopeptide repeat-containing protein [Striga asiatica]|uniref:Pentatricopeptide repeat-containing protein n=1 Tax=Striga asiatica TaxID=4170 RepID=A0A5A7NX96_STRAF|nr:pentatricopeptide repeat-containing protein [Striga asiatica]